MQGISVDELATKASISAHALRRLESGSSRISAAQLFRLARAMDIDINNFFSELPAPDAVGLELDNPGDELERAHLIRYFCQIKNQTARRMFAEMVRSVAESDQNKLQSD